MTTLAHRVITLRYAAVCAQCRHPLEPGTEAWWDRDTRSATCLVCKVEQPPDPFDGVEGHLRGTAGGSAQEEADRRAWAGHSSRSTEPWEKGSDGERRLSVYLHEEAGRGQLEVLDDRRIPGTKANIDLIAVAPPGVFVIDVKNYDGKVELKASGLGRWRREQLYVKGRDRTHLVNGMARQVEAVREALASGDGAGDVPVLAVVCFIGAEWDMFFTAFTVNGVQVMAPRPLRRRLRKEGSLGGGERARLARLLSLRLPPAVPATGGGTGGARR